MDAGPLFSAHRAAGALATIAPGVPTNTVAGAPAANLLRDDAAVADVWRKQATGTGLAQPAPRELEVALTGGTGHLAPLPGGDVDVRDAAQRLVGALWPALFGRTTKDLLGLGATAWHLGAWAARCLAPEGPFPSIRVDDQPYGVLPVTSLPRWRPHAQDPAIEAAMLGPWQLPPARRAGLAADAGTVVGADTPRFVDLLGRLRPAGGPGRAALPIELVELVAQAKLKPFPPGVLASEFDHDVVADLESRAFGLTPRRCYRGVGPLHDIPTRLLGVTDPRGWWSRVARVRRPAGPSHACSPTSAAVSWPWTGPTRPGGAMAVRRTRTRCRCWLGSVRHALLLTHADVARLRWVSRLIGAVLMLPFDHADQPFNRPLAQSELPAVEGDGPDAAAAVRCYRTVREAAEAVREVPENRLQQALLSVLEAATTRIDPWPVGIATRRLRWLAARDTRFRLGAYGWVDAPRPYQPDAATSVQPPGPTPAGLIHAPSPLQAMTGALLRDLAVRKPADTRWDVTIDSASVREAAGLAADAAAGAHLMEALGRRIEQLAGEPGLVDLLRQQYPMRPEHSGRRVCDGEAVLAAAVAEPTTLGPTLAALAPAIRPLQRVVDTYGDLLVVDAIHALADGDVKLAAAGMDAAAGLAAPPQLRALRTLRAGRTVETTTLGVLPGRRRRRRRGPGRGGRSSIRRPPRRRGAARRLDLGRGRHAGHARCAWTVPRGQDSRHPETELHALLRDEAGAGAEAAIGGPGQTAVATARRRLAALLAGDDALPAWLGIIPPADLARPPDDLRLRAQTLIDALRAPGGAAVLPAALRWGARTGRCRGPAGRRSDPGRDLRRAGGRGRRHAGGPAEGVRRRGRRDAATRPAGSYPGSGCRRRGPAGALPRASGCPVRAQPEPDRRRRPALDLAWLETAAAVRPGLARLEAHQLAGERGNGPPPWQAWSSHVDDPWCTGAAEPAPAPTGTTHSVRMLYGPAGCAGRCGRGRGPARPARRDDPVPAAGHRHRVRLQRAEGPCPAGDPARGPARRRLPTVHNGSGQHRCGRPPARPGANGHSGRPERGRAGPALADAGWGRAEC